MRWRTRHNTDNSDTHSSYLTCQTLQWNVNVILSARSDTCSQINGDDCSPLAIGRDAVRTAGHLDDGLLRLKSRMIQAAKYRKKRKELLNNEIVSRGRVEVTQDEVDYKEEVDHQKRVHYLGIPREAIWE